MKNLKRTLALVLCVVMLAGVLGISAFAKSYTEFPDADDVNYTEAVDVMVGLGIVQGNDAGLIDPQGYYTREQAAKIVAYILVGAAAADRLGAPEKLFSDIATNRWSAGYITLGVDRLVLNGYPDGTFKPTGKVTGYEFGKMLLSALGYGKKGEFTGSNWAGNVADLGINLGLYAGVEGACSHNALTREEAMQMAFNALFINTVKYSEPFAMYYDGLTVMDYSGENTTTLGGLKYALIRNTVTDDLGFGGHKWASFGKVVSDFYQDDAIVATYYGGTKTSTITKAYPETSYEADTFVPATSTTPATYAGSIGYVSNGDPKAVYTRTQAKAAVAALSMVPYGTTVYLVDSNYNGKIDKVVVRTEYAAQVASVSTASGTSVINVFAGPTSYPVTIKSTEYAQYTFLNVVPYGDMPALADTEGFISIEEASTLTASATDRQVFTTEMYATLKINGTSYFSTPLSAAIAAGSVNVGTASFALGTRYVFVLNSFGNVAFVAPYSVYTPDTFGLILAYQYTGDLSLWGGAGATSKVLMMDTTGELKQYDVVDSITGLPSKLNGSGGLWIDNVTTAVLVKYTLNANGAINGLTAATNAVNASTPTVGSATFGTGVGAGGVSEVRYVTSNTVFFLFNATYPYSAYNTPKVVKGIANVPAVSSSYSYFATTGTNSAFTAVLYKGGTTAPTVSIGFVYEAAGDTVDLFGTACYRYNVFVGLNSESMITPKAATVIPVEGVPYQVKTVNGETTFTELNLKKDSGNNAILEVELSDTGYVKLANITDPVMFAYGCKTYELTNITGDFTAIKDGNGVIAAAPAGFTTYAYVVLNTAGTATSVYYWFA